MSDYSNSNNTSSGQETPRLLTIAASHYCEKARWALERAKFNYIEEAHVPIFHVLAGRKTAAGKIVPVLVINDDTAMIGGQAILKYLHNLAPDQAQFYPHDPELQQEVEKLEHSFEKQLAPLVAHWAYSYLLNDQRLIRRLWCKGTPSLEKAMFPVIFPIARKLFKKRLGIKAGSTSSTYNQIKEIFESVNRKLADGRTYLIGEQFSAADLTFSALAAAALLCPDYRGVKLPSLEEIPHEMAQGVKELRAMPAGQYAMKLFSREQANQPITVTQ